MESVATSPGILVPLDGSPLAEQVLPYAQALLAPGAELTLLDVVEEPEAIHGMSGRLLVPVEDAQRVLEHQAHEYLQKAEATLHGEQPQVRLEVTRGDPARGDPAGRRRAWSRADRDDHPRPGSAGTLGLWQRRRSGGAQLAGAGAPGAPERTASRSRSLSAASSSRWMDHPSLRKPCQRPKRWPARLGVPIHLITVIDVMRLIPVELAPVVAFDAAVYEDTLSQLDAGAAALLADISQRLEREGLHTSSEVAHGSPFMTIADAVHDGDLIVMTSHGRSGVHRWLLGSVAEKLVREAPVPVVLVPVAARQSGIPSDIPVAH